MRIKITIITLLYTLFNYGQTNITAIYKKELLQKVFTDSKRPVKEEKQVTGFLKNNYLNSVEILKEVRLEFKTNNIESISKIQKNGMLEEANGYGSALVSGGMNIKGVFYCNNFTNKCVHQKDIFDTLFLVAQESNRYHWKLENTVKIIGGFTCYKASSFYKRVDFRGTTHTYNIEVWYTPEIPTHLGPLGYNGLPGLIVYLKQQTKNGGAILSLQKVTQSKKNSVIKKPTKGIKVKNQKEFENKAMEMYRKTRGKRRKYKF